MAIDETIPSLGCGRSIDEVWATINQPPTAHENGCAQCRTARASLAKLAKAARTLRDNDAEDASLRPHHAIKDAIMNLARAEVRRGRRLPVYRADQGGITISEQAITSVIWFGADALAGVRARRCRVHPDPATADDPRPAGTAGISVNLRIAVASGTDIPGTAELLRQRIISMITAHVGLNAGAVNITVEDLYDV
ncbi:Asp23/Gls24 family envelope stress response protein [Arthrobacter sp. ISL-69]|uniref:Asp23/Gls24 family envelope stress response protein n=1 Tax=Arthrobacter sp. ISL-69 TaxID=2819113 RepID=UPI001BEC3C10|nr:Asp23/Gls24 family envelope stress response protein [Arthrobacter sp. ISL-69]MBT2538737.1 Asp23/Gls24 family envelope stress response protein [Arthrobacter sp. ISL-69]